jgi:hypothetical protein
MPMVKDTTPIQTFDNEDLEPPHYMSFILRCWTSDTGLIRCRLIDVHSGSSCPVADLSDLPDLVRRWVIQAVPDQEEME